MRKHIPYILGLVLGFAAPAARAGVLDQLARFELTEPSLNGICETLLMTGRGTRPMEAVERLRDLRLHRLRILEAEPRLLKNVGLDQRASTRSRTALAGHLRGIEVWGQRAAGAADAGSPRLAALSLVGSDAIEDYYRGLTDLRADVLEWTRVHPEARGYGQIISMLNVVTPILLGFSAIELGQADPNPAVLTEVGAAATALIGLTGSANQFRFRRDGRRASFDRDLHAYLTAEPSRPGADWIFSTRTYRVLQPLTNAVWANDQRTISDGLIEHRFLESFPVIKWIYDHLLARSSVERASRRLGYVVVDHLLEFDAGRGAPRLSIVLRTSTDDPRKVTAGFAAETRARAAAGGRLVPSPGGY